MTDDNTDTGTTVRISQIPTTTLLDRHESIGALLLEFALYLKSYPTVSLFYDGEKIDPNKAEITSSYYDLPPFELSDDRTVLAGLEIVEWRRAVDRAIFLCDASVSYHKFLRSE